MPARHPVLNAGVIADADLARELDVDPATRSTYQGPTKIVGVIGQIARERGIPSASLWANMPFYVQRTPNPKGTLAILERLNRCFHFDLTLHDLEVFAARFEAQVASDIEGNPEVAAYARRVADQDEEDDSDIDIEMEPEDELPDAETMVDELERFLREQRGEGGDTQGDHGVVPPGTGDGRRRGRLLPRLSATPRMTLS